MLLENDDLLSMYRLMMLGRTFDQEITKKKGGWHATEGEEATIVGTFYNLKKDDVVVPHYRGSVLVSYMRGAPLWRLVAGIMGKATGFTRGRYRGDLCGPVEFNIIGMISGTLGPTISLGTGAALAAKLKKTNNVAVVSFGDGTSNRGEFHEAINLAAVLDLPAVFICQNNQYSISTHVSKALRCNSVADRAVGYGIPGIEVDGNDVMEIYTAVQESVKRAREGDGPTLIEAKTYRLGGHMAGDPELYRQKQEVEKWKKKDPLPRFKKKLIDMGVLTENKVQEIQKAVKEEIFVAIRMADEQPFAGEKELGIDDIFAPAKGKREEK